MGSVRSAVNVSASRYFPYGEEQTTTTQDRDKFGTYYRDGTTGLDYAQNRYYASTLGRFLSPDPYTASVGPADPGSWNRYAYTRGRSNQSNGPEVDIMIVQWTSLAYVAGEVGTGGPGDPGCPFSYEEGGCAPEPDPEPGGGELAANPDEQLGLGSVYLIVPDSNSVHQKMINLAKLSLRKALAANPKCQNWLESGFAHGNQTTFNSLWNQMTTTSGTYLGGQPNAIQGSPLSLSTISINANGAFFNSNAGIAYVGSQWLSLMNSIQPNTMLAREFIILHEAAHYFGVPNFGNDANTGNPAKDQQLQISNNNLLLQNCESGIFTGGII